MDRGYLAMKMTLFIGASVLALALGAASADSYVPSMVVRPATRPALHPTPPPGSAVLYDQSDSAGFAKYAIPSWWNTSEHPYTTPDLAADDFVIPGTGSHTITAVYAAGVNNGQQAANVTFFSNLRYNRKTGATTAVVKATCQFMPLTYNSSGVMVDLSSCDLGTFRAGHDYAVSVQTGSPGGIWYWQTNRKRIGRPGFWYDYGGGGSGSCYEQLTPIKLCFPTKGYGPDLAFAIYGN